MTTHPVHIVDEHGELSPTALIPFCQFGGNMSLMGVKIDKFDLPVCNSFKAKILNDQHCYSVDPNKFRGKINLKNELSLTLFIDYNEDREYGKIIDDNDNRQHSIIVETIGKSIAMQFVMK